jgi:hypothetical protein
VPPCPEGLSVSAQRRWTELWKTDVAGAWRAEHHAGIRRLLELYDLRDFAHARYKERPESTGSTGQLTVSPWAKELDSLDKRIEILENAYGLNPYAWNRLGVEVVTLTKATADAAPEEPTDDPRYDMD